MKYCNCNKKYEIIEETPIETIRQCPNCKITVSTIKEKKDENHPFGRDNNNNLSNNGSRII